MFSWAKPCNIARLQPPVVKNGPAMVNVHKTMVGTHTESQHNDAVDSITEKTHEQKLIQWDQERCKQIWTGTLHNGLLINFDYATKLDQSQPWALTAGDCTISPGTICQDKHITQTMLKPWVSMANPTDAVNLGLHKRGLVMELGMVTDEFTTFFKPLCSTVNKLLRVLRSNWSTSDDALNYKTVRDILLE
ncbi:hypothetical protein EDC04DRAFT_2601880, partial [Pisolithus marmoratus]